MVVRKHLDQRGHLVESEDRQDSVEHDESGMLDEIDQYQTNMHCSNVQPGLHLVG